MGGIYRIFNIVNKKSYVGSTCDFSIRFYKHVWKLKSNRHENLYLQNAWNKYGENSFRFEKIKECSNDVLLSEEQKFLTVAEKNKDNFYNFNFIAAKPPSPKGRKASPETKKKLSLVKRGKNNPHFGKKLSEITRHKMSKSRSKKTFVFLNPNKEKVEIINLKDFCRKNSLNDGAMYSVHSGRISQYKGWIKFIKTSI